MRLLLDEHLSPAIARELRSRGIDVLAAAERRHLRGRADRAQFATAESERRALVTRDVADYRPLLAATHRAGGHAYGLVCISRRFRQDREGSARLIGSLEALLRDHPGDSDLGAEGGEVWLTDSAGAG